MRLLIRLIPILLLVTPALPAADAVLPVFDGFPRGKTLVPGRLYVRSPPGMGRITVITYHNGSVYTSNVAGGSPRRWTWSDTDRVDSLALVQDPSATNNAGDGSHGTYFADRRLAGSIFAESPGVNISKGRSQSDQPPSRPWIGSLPGMLSRDDVSGTYYPWYMPFSWHQYGSASGITYIARGGAAPLLKWNLKEQCGHLGKAILLGDLMILVDDESGGGVSTFHLAPLFADVPAPPILLDHVSLPDGLGTYLGCLWRNVVVLASRNKRRIDFVDIADPTDLKLLKSLPLGWDTAIAPGNNDMYTQCQDQYVFSRRSKIDMLPLLGGGDAQVVLRFDTVGDQGRPAGSVAGPIDISQSLYPLGNLLLTGGYTFSGRDCLGVWAHQAAPDTAPPTVGYHRPRPGQTRFPVGAPISLVINEELSGPTIVNGVSIILREVGSTVAVPAWTSFSHDDILTLTPLQYLRPNTAYELVIPAGGIRDAVGNAMAPFSFTFRTGASGSAPVISGLALGGTPAAAGNQVTITVSASDADGDPREYRLDPGDRPAGSPRGAWQSSPVFQHVYSAVGHFRATVQVRDGTGLASARSIVVPVLPPAPPTQPVASGPLWLDHAARRIWTVDPDLDRVTCLHADSLTVLRVIDLRELTGKPLVEPRSIAGDALGQIWIAGQRSDSLVVLRGSDGTLHEEKELGYGSAPVQVVADPGGSTVMVTTTARAPGEPSHGALLRYAAAGRSLQQTVPLGPTPHAIAVTAAGDRVLVTRFRSSPDRGTVWSIPVTEGGMGPATEITIARDRGPDQTDIGRGVPTALAAIAIAPDATWAWYGAVKANTQRGTLFGATATHDSRLRALAGRIRLADSSEPEARAFYDRGYRIDIDNSDSPSAISFTTTGDYAFVALQGNDHVAVFDGLALAAAGTGTAEKDTVWRIPTGAAPQGMVYDPARQRLLIKDGLGRSLSVVELRDFLATGERTATPQRIATGGGERLPARVLAGKVLFHRAGDALGPDGASRMSLDYYISCASCHAGGGHDGMVWDVTQRGEGLRNTIDLRGKGGMAQGNLHWSANFDEVQDFQHELVGHFGGTGLLAAGESAYPPLGTANAGRSADLDALAAYVASLGPESVPRSPHRAADGRRDAAALRGSAVFAAQQCGTCHVPSRGYTDSTLGIATLHDVGTLSLSSGSRLGVTLTGIDTPSLSGLWQGGPYLHDGSAVTLDEVFSVAGGTLLEAEHGTGTEVSVVNDAQGYNGGINDDSSYSDRHVVFNANGDRLTFIGINGGPGGPAQVAIRVVARATTTLRVQAAGQDHDLTLVAEDDDAAWSWRRVTVNLAAGSGNELVLQQVGAGRFDVDALVIVSVAQLARAAPHRRVLALPEGERSDLLAFLRSIDGQDLPGAVAHRPSLRRLQVRVTPGDTTFVIEPDHANAVLDAGGWTLFPGLEPTQRYRLLPLPAPNN